MMGNSAAAVRLKTLQDRQTLSACPVCGSSSYEDRKVKVSRR